MSDNAAQASNAELMASALEHYERVSSIAHEWNSGIPRAIRYWYEHRAAPTEHAAVTNEHVFTEPLTNAPRSVTAATIYTRLLDLVSELMATDPEADSAEGRLLVGLAATMEIYEKEIIRTAEPGSQVPDTETGGSTARAGSLSSTVGNERPSSSVDSGDSTGSAVPSAPLTHTDHPPRHWDRTCPACQAEDTVPHDSFADLPSEKPSGLVEELNAMANHVGSLKVRRGYSGYGADISEESIIELLVLLRRAAGALKPGMVSVPEQPTQAMVDAGMPWMKGNATGPANVWVAMVRAAKT